MATARTARPAPPTPAANGADDAAAAWAHVRAVVAGSGTSFFWAMRLLPRRNRPRSASSAPDGDCRPTVLATIHAVST